MRLSRRGCLTLAAGFAVSRAQAMQAPPSGASPVQDARQPDATEPADWTCLMDPDVHLDKPGKCPRCGMQLVLRVPDRVEFPMELRTRPEVLEPGKEAELSLAVMSPQGVAVGHFDIVHEKLMHLFVVSQDLSFFAHIHPVLQPDGTFKVKLIPPEGGMYRVLADFFPSGSVPQLALGTFFVDGTSKSKPLTLTSGPQQSANMSADFHIEPAPVLSGFLSRLVYQLSPAEGFEPYLGAWGHMLVASEDLVDLIHLHPFLVNGADLQFNAILPRACKYRVWAQFQRQSVVNTFAYTVEAKNL